MPTDPAASMPESTTGAPSDTTIATPPYSLTINGDVHYHYHYHTTLVPLPSPVASALHQTVDLQGPGPSQLGSQQSIGSTSAPPSPSEQLDFTTGTRTTVNPNNEVSMAR